MRVLLTHRFFWPDTAPYALMLRSIGNALSAAGHEVSVFASKPSYRSSAQAPARERLGALTMRRIAVLPERRRNPLFRAINVGVYCVALFAHILRTRPDVVTASTFPPVLAAWTASLGARLVGARFVYHMMDIHPEVSRISGGLLGRAPISTLLRWLDNHTLRRAAAIVVLSSDMADTIHARRLGALPIHVIDNFHAQAFETAARQDPPPELVRKPGTRRVIFAGNLGRFQNLELLVEGVVAGLANHADSELLLLGSGAVEDALKARWSGHPQVRFGPFLPAAQAHALIADSQVALVSLQPGMHRVACPSKLAGYCALGVPVLALIEPHSAIARDIRENRLGAVAADFTPQAVAEALDGLLSSPDPAPGLARRAYASRADAVLRRWAALVAALPLGAAAEP